MRDSRSGAPVHAIPTVFRGKPYRSRFEADTALLLAKLGVAADYEPQSFLFDDGTHYLPDFYVPSLRLWIECRGYESAKGERQIEGFARVAAESDADYLVIGSARMGFYVPGAAVAAPMLGRCRKCGAWRFAGAASPSSCRSCSGSGLVAPEFLQVLDGKILVGPVFLETWARPAEKLVERRVSALELALRAATTAEEEDALLAQVQAAASERLARRAAR